MIKKEKLVKQIRIKGHAMYADFGKDIVCAGVSSILTTTVNAILSFDKNAITYDSGLDFVLEVKKEDKITTTLIDNMLNLFTELASRYPKNIKIGRIIDNE